jgi:hypothetical protein
MSLQKRIIAFTKLGELLRNHGNTAFLDSQPDIFKKYANRLNQQIQNAFIHNPWFTDEFVKLSLKNTGELLVPENINKWLSNYSIPDKSESKKIGVVMAGNIPLVGFHDMLSVLITGNTFLGKLSTKDSDLMTVLASFLQDIEPAFEDKIYFTEEHLSDFDAIIATGSDNTSRYFEYYFGKYPHIIRKNRNSVAILSGDESDEDLKLFADDVFLYFGLGCRNVSKIFVPENYDFDRLINAFQHYAYFADHKKYRNNYDYNKAFYLMNKLELYEGGFFMIIENESFSSPISVIHFEYYSEKDKLNLRLEENKDKLQCVIGITNDFSNLIPFGEAQKPALWNYADNVDTMNFILNL